MYDELRTLLHNCATAEPIDSSRATFVTMFGTVARWSIMHNKHTEFWLQLCRLVYELMGPAGDPDAPMCIAEIPQPEIPVIADLTFRYRITRDDQRDPNWEAYPETMLYHLVHIYQSVIAENFAVEATLLVQLLCVVQGTDNWLEAGPNGEQMVCTSVRLQFPYARIDTKLQMDLIRTKVIQRMQTHDIFSTGNVYANRPCGDPETWISATLGKEPIVMYGSSAAPGRPKYEVRNIWRFIPDPTFRNGMVDPTVTIANAFQMGNHVDVQKEGGRGLVDLQQLWPYVQHSGMQWLLPMLLSLGHWQPVLRLRDDAMGGELPTAYSNQQDFSDADDLGPVTEMQVLQMLLSMLEARRFHYVNYWSDIGQACHSASNGEDEGLMWWTRSSQRAVSGMDPVPPFMIRPAKGEEDERWKKLSTDEKIAETCRDLYDTFNKKHITIQTLHVYAAADSPVPYGKWHARICKAAMKLAIKDPFDHARVAESFVKMYRNKYVCQVSNGSSGASGRWFYYDKHRWIENPGGTKLRTCMSNEFRKRYEDAAVDLSKKIRNTDGMDQSGFGKKKNSGPGNENETSMNNIYKLTCLLGTVSYKNNLMRECMDQFAMSDFTELLDTNSNLTGLPNGIIEIVDKVAISRPGKPEDYISMCTNVPLVNYERWDHPLVEKTMKWLGQTFPNKELLHHFIKFAASGLIGGNPDKIFAIMTGCGDNSKSMIIKLFEAVFGPYSIKLPVSMLFEKISNSSGPSPHLARARSTRFAFMDEPEDDITLQKGVIKRFTGGDRFFARKLMENGGDIAATFKMVLVCNKVPVIPNADKAIKGRVKLFPFLARWVDNPPPEAEQMKAMLFLKNTEFEKSIPEMAAPFLFIIFKYFTTYATQGMKVDPPIIADSTKNYWDNNDVYAQFVYDCVQEVRNPATGQLDETARVSLRDMYNEFKLWHKEAFPGILVPNRAFVRTELSARWGDMRGNGWYGYRLAVDDESAANNMAPGRNVMAADWQAQGHNMQPPASGYRDLPLFQAPAAFPQENGQAPNGFAQAQAMAEAPNAFAQAQSQAMAEAYGGQGYNAQPPAPTWGGGDAGQYGTKPSYEQNQYATKPSYDAAPTFGQVAGPAYQQQYSTAQYQQLQNPMDQNNYQQYGSSYDQAALAQKLAAFNEPVNNYQSNSASYVNYQSSGHQFV